MTTTAFVAHVLPFVPPFAVAVSRAVRIASYLGDGTPKGLAIRTAAAEQCVWAVAAAVTVFAYQIGAA